MITILMYHQVAEVAKELDPRGLAIPPTQFERQMSLLAHSGYKCISMQEAVQQFLVGRKVPEKSFVLTFDDGYQDFYSNARPILEKYGFTATVFLVANRLGMRSNWWGQDKEHSGLLLSMKEARNLVKLGFTLGSHTLTHPFLHMLDEHTAFQEIRNSRILLQDQLDTQIDYFSYPFSETNSQIEALVRTAGYSAACAGDSGPWGIFHLWRVPCLRTDTPLTLFLKINGWYDKKTSLRESIPGLFLRRSVRLIRRRLGILHPHRQNLPNYGITREPRPSDD